MKTSKQIAYGIVYNGENFSGSILLKNKKEIQKTWDEYNFYRRKLRTQLQKDGYYTLQGVPTKKFFARGIFTGRLAVIGHRLFNKV